MPPTAPTLRMGAGARDRGLGGARARRAPRARALSRGHRHEREDDGHRDARRACLRARRASTPSPAATSAIPFTTAVAASSRGARRRGVVVPARRSRSVSPAGVGAAEPRARPPRPPRVVRRLPRREGGDLRGTSATTTSTSATATTRRRRRSRGARPARIVGSARAAGRRGRGRLSSGDTVARPRIPPATVELGIGRGRARRASRGRRGRRDGRARLRRRARRPSRGHRRVRRPRPTAARPSPRSTASGSSTTRRRRTSTRRWPAIAAVDDAVLIAGGRAKGQDLARWRAGAAHLRAVVAIGEAAAAIQDGVRRVASRCSPARAPSRTPSAAAFAAAERPGRRAARARRARAGISSPPTSSAGTDSPPPRADSRKGARMAERTGQGTARAKRGAARSARSTRAPGQRRLRLRAHRRAGGAPAESQAARAPRPRPARRVGRRRSRVVGLVMVLSAGSVSAAQGYGGNSFWYFQRQVLYAVGRDRRRGASRRACLRASGRRLGICRCSAARRC